MSNYDLLFHCAPTLANVKVGNMFTVQYDSKAELEEIIAEKNLFFVEKGVCVRVLKWMEKSALIYVFRFNKLQEVLSNPEITEFLSGFSYKSFSLSSALTQLEAHLQEKDFPHEIGVFLGYPLEDIRGFIQHGGKNYHMTGIWKVYHKPETAEKTFQRYKKCMRVYLERYACGTDMSRLTVVG